MKVRAWIAALLLRLGRLGRIESKIDRLAERTEELMSAQNDQLRALAAALDAETNAIAARIDDLTKKLAAAQAAGEPPDQAALDALASVSERLKVLGADPANPVPAPAPAPTP